MLWFQAFILSLVQGLTEFLPVSSSAHLILVPAIFGWEDQGLAFDTAVHLGTLLAVLSYFKQELVKMAKDFFRSLSGGTISSDAKIFWSIGFATIPVGLVGLLCKNFIETSLRSPKVIALTTIGFGLILWGSDKWSRKKRKLTTMHWRDVTIIGLSQALSLIPGTSRSGITLTAGLWCGFTREAAARFSFLLSIPVILLAGGLEAITLLKNKDPVNWEILGLGVCLSAMSGYFCIHYFLKLLSRIGLFPFVLYRLCLGIFLLFYVLR